MLMTDVKRGINFWGRIHDSDNGDRSIFEGIVMDVKKCNDFYFKGFMIKALTVIVKSNNPFLIGRMEVIHFTDKNMEEFYENESSHFISMDNLYKVLNIYNPNNYYTDVKVIYFDEEQESIPVFSFISEKEPLYAFLILKLQNQKMIQIISLMDTCMTIDYENPYIWVNIVDSSNELLLNTNQKDFFDSNYVYTRTPNIYIENLQANSNLMEFFAEESVIDSSAFNTFRGIGINCNSELQIIVFDSQTEDNRIHYGSGIDVKRK